MELEPHRDWLWGLGYRMLGSAADAEDLVQDTMLRAYKAILNFDGRHPRAWLLTIMRNAQINRVRRKRPELLRDPDTTFDQQANEPGGEKGPEAVVEDATFDAAVESALDRLPEKFRHVIDLVDVQGLSYNEAAAVMDVPTGTVMSRLHRARTKIRTELERTGAFVNGRPAA